MRPQVKVSVAFGATNATTLSSSVDCIGYTYATFVASNTGGGGLHSTVSNTYIEESDDNSTFTTISTGVTMITNTAVTTTARCIWNVDLRGRKRYIRPKFDLNAAACPNITAILYNAQKDQPVTAALANATNFVTI